MKEYIASTSRDLDPLKRAWLSVVYQEGKSVLDSELNLSQSLRTLRRHKDLPSGVLSDYPFDSEEGSFVYYDNLDPLFQPNTLTIKSFSARVAGQEVLVSGTASADENLNHVLLPPPSLGAQSPDIKRTDFVFLEVWKALVTPTSSATGYIRVLAVGSLTNGDVLNFDGSSLPAGSLVQLEAGVDFDIGLTEAETARNISDAINLINPADLGVAVTADTRGTEFVYLTFGGGLDGNSISLSAVLATAGGLSLQQPVGGSDGTGIPQADKIYFAGNTECDPSLYFDEDLRDPLQGVETTKRVQLQYRFRVYSEDYDGAALLDGVNPKTQPFGFENENIVAQGGQGADVAGYYFTRADGNDVIRPDGNTNSYPYTDTGLFFTGDGSEQSATDLGSLDGYVYAIPICFVFRRNEGRFNPSLHVNDGPLSDHVGFGNSEITQGVQFQIPVGSSDRPDGLFSDQVASQDILDLRRRVFVNGCDYTQELSTQFQRLLDNQVRTWAMDGSDYRTIGSGSGDISTTPLICDEIGKSVALGGQAASRGTFIRNLDRVCTRFSDASVVQKLFLKIDRDVNNTQLGGSTTVTAGDPATNNWYEGDTIEIDFDALDLSSRDILWSGNQNFSQLFANNVAPVGTVITNITGRHDEGYTLGDIDTTMQFKRVEGLGSSVLTLTLDRNQTTADGGEIGAISTTLVGDAVVGDTGSFNHVWLEITVEYPQGEGLSATPVENLEADEITVNTGGGVDYYIYGEGSSVALDSVDLFGNLVEFKAHTREGSRDVVLAKTTPEEYIFISESATQVYIPYGISLRDNNPVVVDISDGANPTNVALDLSASSFGTVETTLVFQNSIGGQRRLRITADFLEPMPNLGFQFSVYYRAAAPQTCGTKAAPILTLVPSSLTLKPIAISDKVWAIQLGSGSSDEGFPYSAPSVQIGVHTNVSEYTSESSLFGSSLISLDDFEINSGLASLPSFLPMDGTGNVILNNPVLDVEGRVVYEGTSDLLYKPSSYAKGLREAIAHKNAVPMLARVEEDSTLYRRGEIVLVVVSRYSEAVNIASGVEASKANMVQFSPSEDRTVACVFRTQNLLLSGD